MIINELISNLKSAATITQIKVAIDAITPEEDSNNVLKTEDTLAIVVSTTPMSEQQEVVISSVLTDFEHYTSRDREILAGSVIRFLRWFSHDPDGTSTKDSTVFAVNKRVAEIEALLHQVMLSIQTTKNYFLQVQLADLVGRLVSFLSAFVQLCKKNRTLPPPVSGHDYFGTQFWVLYLEKLMNEMLATARREGNLKSYENPNAVQPNNTYRQAAPDPNEAINRVIWTLSTLLKSSTTAGSPGTSTAFMANIGRVQFLATLKSAKEIISMPFFREYAAVVSAVEGEIERRDLKRRANPSENQVFIANLREFFRRYAPYNVGRVEQIVENTNYSEIEVFRILREQFDAY